MAAIDHPSTGQVLTIRSDAVWQDNPLTAYFLGEPMDFGDGLIGFCIFVGTRHLQFDAHVRPDGEIVIQNQAFSGIDIGNGDYFTQLVLMTAHLWLPYLHQEQQDDIARFHGT